jgi:hypothetical protein
MFGVITLATSMAGWGGVPVVAEPEERVGETQHYYAIAEPDDAGGFWIS